MILCLFCFQLYDLMTMAFKYQVSLALCPKDILLITLNHMDAIRNFVKGQANIEQQVDHVYQLLIKVGFNSCHVEYFMYYTRPPIFILLLILHLSS